MLIRRLIRGVSFACVASLLVVDGASAAESAIRPAAPVATASGASSVLAAAKAEPVGSRPDVVSAGVSARAQGSRVEVEGLRSETATTWVNPDGSLTTQEYAGPIRFKNAAGVWEPVKLALEAPTADGSTVVDAHPDAVEFGGTDEEGAAALAQAGPSKARVSLGWGKKLGKPAISGQTARWADVTPGVDVVAQSRRSGFEALIVVKSPQALAAAKAPAAKTSAGGVSWSLPLKTRGLTAKVAADGGVDFTDGGGKVVSRIAPMLAWDAKTDASGGPASTVKVAASVVQKGKGKAVLTLTPDQEWLTDPARTFPITVDPTYATGQVNPSYDGFVQTGFSSDQSTSAELRAGTYDGGSTVARTYMRFPNAVQGMQVISANLSLYETYSYSCTAKPLSVFKSSQPDRSTTWANQPAITTPAMGSVSAARGYSSSCPAGRVTVPVTSLAQAWSTDAATSVSLSLRAGSESDSYGWKKFASSESNTPPFISYTYNRKPNAASAPVAEKSAQYNGSRYVSYADSPFTATATDPDGNGVKVTFEVHSTTTSPSPSTRLASCESPVTASGKTASCVPTPALPDGRDLFVRAAVRDERGLWNGTWSAWAPIKTAMAKPAAPTISCTGFANGSWAASAPASAVPCTATIPAAANVNNQPVRAYVYVDGAATPTSVIDTAQKAGTFGGFSVPNTPGGHSVKVFTQSASTWASDRVEISFGWGDPSVEAPTAGSATNGKLTVKAVGPPSNGVAASAKVRFRVAGDAAAPWSDGPALSTGGSGAAMLTAAGVWDTAQAVSGDAVRTPTLLEMSVCFTYGGTQKCSTPVTVTRLPHAFGAGYPTSEAGPGQVGLYTGEVAVDASDVEVPGYAGELSISRSHASFTGDGTLANWPGDPVTGVFGPGWTGALEGPEAGFAGTQIIDSTRRDGTIALVDGVEDPLVFRQPGAGRVQDKTGSYDAATEDTFDSGTKLTLTGAGASMTLTITEEDGTTTVFAPVAAPAAGVDTAWKPVSVKEPGQAGTTTYGHDVTGRVTRIVAAVPTGIDPATCPTTGTLAKGCRALNVTYGASTTATAGTPGDVVGQVKSVSATLWDPATSTMKTTPVATYAYNESKRLVKVTDPRSGLGTGYGWVGGSTRLASVTPAGQAPWRFSYDNVLPGQPRLAQVTRDPATSGGPSMAVSSFAYDIDATTATDGLPDLRAARVADWFQARPPVKGYAVFDAAHPVGSTVPAQLSAGDWSFADLQYVDDLGYTVNTAGYGAGAWQLTATDYDSLGNTVRSLDERAINQVTDAKNAGSALSVGQVDALSTQTIYNTEVKNPDGTVVLPAGSREESTTLPARPMTLADGTSVRARPRTVTSYDQGAPNAGVNPATGQRYSLATTVTEQVVDVADAVIATSQVTVNSYDPLVAGDGDGWAFGTPTTVKTGTSATSTDVITSRNRFNAEGRAVEDRQPLSNGTDAGTVKTSYYTAGANSADASCSNRPEWAGLTCRTFPAAAPSSGPTMPDERTSAYTMWLAPATTVETSGAGNRTTTQTFDAADRPITSATTVTGVAGSTPRPGTYTKYDPATGQVAYTGTVNSAGTDADPANRTTTNYDAWGRETSRTTDQGITVTTAYDTAGRVATVTDPKGTLTYGYDGTDAAGKLERRGKPTRLSVTRGSTAGNATFTAAYDADGAMTTQTLPGRITQRLETDEIGQSTGLSYSGQVTTVTESVDPVTGQTVYTPTGVEQDQPWLAWTRERDPDGKVAREYTGNGAATDGAPGVSDPADIAAPSAGRAVPYTRDYRYDVHGRLTSVRDRTAPATGGDADDSACRVTSYAFDANGRRTSKASGTYAPTCTGTATGATSTSYAYDTADRATTGANGSGSYVYDLLGRATTVPAGDAPDPAKGGITLGYFDDDLPRSINQNGSTTTFTLTLAGRRKDQSTTNAAGAVTSSLQRFYTDESDNPAWVIDDADGAGPKAPATTRYAESVAGDLGTSIADNGAMQISLANPHGDAVTSIDIPTTQTEDAAAVAITAWSDYTEYGSPTNPASAGVVGGAAGYAWLGAKQRSTSAATTASLTLMGDRLYNPATGGFTSPDPERDGNTTLYTYPQDPINEFDLDGHWGWSDAWKGIKRAAKKVGNWAWRNKKEIALTAVSFVPGLGMAAWGYRAYRGYKLIRGGVYVVRTARGGKYVGQSANVGRRLKRHVRSGKITAKQARKARIYHVRGGKTRREVAEQRAINRRGGIRKLENARNPIGPKRKHLMKKYPRQWWNGL